MVSAPGDPARRLHLSDGLIDLDARDDIEIDAGGLIACPGFIDIQVNGGWSHDFTSHPDSIWEVGARLPETGVTSYLPTMVTSPADVYDKAIDVVTAGPPAGYRGADVLGLHFEGPWLSPDFAGAHDHATLADPDPVQARAWAESGVVRLVTMAPELEGAWDVAESLADSGIVVSIGHTGADYDTAQAALDGPWSAFTHLYNQMSGFGHRAPGVVGAALTLDAWTGIIADGIHSAPGALQLAVDSLTPAHLVLITDAMAAMGLGPGEFALGSKLVTVGDSGPRLPDGRLAGSTLTMDNAVATLVRDTSADLPTAIAAATSNPAAMMGLEDRGRLEAGKRADIVLMEDSGRIAGAIVTGDILFGPGA